MILLCSISCNDLNGDSVDDCVDGEDGGDSFIQSSLTCRHLSSKIRFEEPKRQRGREGNSKDAVKLF